MKKMMGLLASLLVVFSLTGCGSKGNELKCIGEVDGQKSTMVATIKDEKVVKYSVETVQEFEDEESLNTAYGFSQLAVGMFQDVEGVSMEVKKKGKKLIMSGTIDLSKVDAEAMEALGIESNISEVKEMTKEDFIAYAEEEGLTCK